MHIKETNVHQIVKSSQRDGIVLGSMSSLCTSDKRAQAMMNPPMGIRNPKESDQNGPRSVQ